MLGTGIHEKRIQNFYYFTNTLTLLGLGLIKINDM